MFLLGCFVGFCCFGFFANAVENIWDKLFLCLLLSYMADFLVKFHSFRSLRFRH